MMTCREILDFLMEYLDGNLSAAQRAMFEEHFAVCPSCVAYLHNYRQTMKLVRSVRCKYKPEGISEELLQKVVAARPAVY
jgi:anti-sigma factor RsiW